MDLIRMVIQSPGYIFGPLMMLAGLVALAMCVRATFRADRTTARSALRWSLLPPALGVLGAIVGAIVYALVDQPNKDWGTASKYLGCTILFGVFVVLPSAMWALVLFKRRPAAVA